MKVIYNLLLIISSLIFFTGCNNYKQPTYHNKYDISFFYEDTIRKFAYINLKITSYNDKDTIMYQFAKDNVKIKSLYINCVRCDFLFKGNDSLLIFPKEKKDRNEINICYCLAMDSIKINTVYFLDSWSWCPRIKNKIVELSLNAFVPDDYFMISKDKSILTINRLGKMYSFAKNMNITYAFIIYPKNFYKEIKTVVNNIPINYYFINKNKQLLDSIVSDYSDLFKYCSQKIGNYNRNELKILERPVDYNDSKEGLLIAGSWDINNYNRWGGHYRELFPHELIHQWFGSGVFGKLKTGEDKHPYTYFLSETLTEFIRWEYLESKYGHEKMQNFINNGINEYYSQIIGTMNDLPISSDKNIRVMYACAPLIYYYIRSKIGMDNWNKFLKEYYNHYKGNYIGLEEFEKELSNYLDKKEINILNSYLDNKFSYFFHQNKSLFNI